MGTWSPTTFRRTLERVRRAAAPTEEVPRIANPFARFRTRSRWLAEMMREGRDADPRPLTGSEALRR